MRITYQITFHDIVVTDYRDFDNIQDAKSFHEHLNSAFGTDYLYTISFLP